ncbi:MAG: efflux RND transporter periplasmic adaptor subunit [Cyclobacteriaceae bacterium]
MKKILILLLVVGSINQISCTGHANNEKKDRIESYTVYQPIQIDTIYYSEFVADISAIRNVEIRSRVTGYMENIHIDEGQRVQQGQLLFSLSDQEYKEAVLKAEAKRKSALADLKAMELEMQSTETLLKNDIISNTQAGIVRARLEAAKAQVEVAKSQEKDAQLNLSYTKIKAPFSGVVNRINNKVGSLIDESTLITSLSDDSEIFAYFNLSEKEYYEFIEQKKDQGEQSVQLILATGDMHTSQGKIETIDGQFDIVTGNISVRARFKNPNFLIKHQSTGKIRFGKKLENVLVIPQKSTFEIQDKTFVYCLDDQNKIVMKSLIPALKIPHLYIVDNGITDQDRIIYEGIQQVKVNQEINPEFRPLSDIILELN